MSRLSVITFVATVVVGMAFMASCRIHHLGSDHGKRYQRAIDAQAAGDSSVESTSLSADDANRIMRVHATGETKGSGKGSSTTTSSFPTPSSGTSSSSIGSGKWQGSSGNINLEAK